MRSSRPSRVFGPPLLAALLFASSSCEEEETCAVDCASPGVTALMSYEAAEFFDAPFPSAARVDAEGRPILDGFPNPQNVVLVERVLDLLRSDARGFGLSAGVFIRFSGALDLATLPSLADSVKDDASVQLMGVDPESPDYLQRYPVKVGFNTEAKLYGAPNLLSVLPLQGVPLRPRTRYAVLVTSRVKDGSGAALGVPAALDALASGEAPAGMSDAALAEHLAALAAIEQAGIASTEIVALTAFTTDDPTETMALAVEQAVSQEVPTPSAFTLLEEYPTYCVFESSLEMPVYQSGTPPYLEEGGGWALDADGLPMLDHHETARFWITIPKVPMPAGGYPLVVFSRTGGGGDNPLVDRGVRAEPGGPSVEPGTGPALELARVGFAGASVDGPHGGLRNVSGSDEQFLVFNFQNPLALRDNVRQSALELALLPEVLAAMPGLDVSACPGATTTPVGATFDQDTLAIMGHSMGAAISPLSLVYSPHYRAILLSGAGGSFLENMVHKQKPLAVKPLAEVILGLAIAGYELGEESPILSMLQWAGEPADAPIYGRYIIEEPKVAGPRNVLMMQGIVDHYIMPPIANATSLSFGLDLGGEALDATVEELSELDPLVELLPLVGREALSFPVSGNRDASGTSVTAVVIQYPEDGIEDGHEVMFQTEAPKHAYACFLASLASGEATVPEPGVPGDACE